MPKMLAVGLVLLLTLLTASALAASNTFIDHFDARLGSHLEDPDSAFTVTSGEIHRKIPTSGLDRRYVRTIPTSHDSGDWTYTITFDITNTSKPEIVFIGVGSGAAGGPYNEPIDSAEFRIHNQAIGGGMVHMAVSNANGLFTPPPPRIRHIHRVSTDRRPVQGTVGEGRRFAPFLYPRSDRHSDHERCDIRSFRHQRPDRKALLWQRMARNDVRRHDSRTPAPHNEGRVQKGRLGNLCRLQEPR